jgi:hypothetical protein
MDGAADQAVAPQRAQRGGQHPLADAVDLAVQFAEPAGAGSRA